VASAQKPTNEWYSAGVHCVVTVPVNHFGGLLEVGPLMVDANNITNNGIFSINSLYIMLQSLQIHLGQGTDK